MTELVNHSRRPWFAFIRGQNGFGVCSSWRRSASAGRPSVL